MNHLVIDLEMCNVPKTYMRDYRYSNEIIQIGAVLLDENYERIATFNQYVCPEYGVLDSFIEKLTGIHNSDIKDAPGIKEVLERLIDWIGDREYKVYAWSKSDIIQLKHEVKAKNIKNDRIRYLLDERRWIDYQSVFSRRYRLGRAYSLEEALLCAKIVPEGQFHCGLDDALNTANLIKMLETNPDYEIIRYDISSDEERLSSTIGDMFGDILKNINNVN